MKPQPFSHSYGESNFHIVFSPKYRHNVLTGRIAKVCDLAFEQAGQVWNFRIVTKRVSPDHIHQFVSLRPNQSPSWTVHKLKGRSARKLFKTFSWLKQFDPKDKRRFWGGELWSDGYFFRYIGSTTDKAIQFYIDVANDPILRKEYYTYAGNGKREPKRKDYPYVSFLQGKLRLSNKNQRRLTQFVNAG